jgi:hypothetical protein
MCSHCFRCADACAVGRYQNAPSQAECIDCPEGRFQPNVRQSTCEFCSPGKFQDQPGTTGCVSCTPGKSQGGTAATVRMHVFVGLDLSPGVCSGVLAVRCGLVHGNERSHCVQGLPGRQLCRGERCHRLQGVPGW